jgi:hypothetical protein
MLLLLPMLRRLLVQTVPRQPLPSQQQQQQQCRRLLVLRLGSRHHLHH